MALEVASCKLNCEPSQTVLLSCCIDGSRGLFVPSSPELVLERPQLLNPTGKCPIHNTSIDFWCYNDEVLLCGGCRISCHLGHDVVRLLDRNKEELESFYGEAEEAVELVSNMKKTCSYIKGQSERVKLEYDLLIKQVKFYSFVYSFRKFKCEPFV